MKPKLPLKTMRSKASLLVFSLSLLLGAASFAPLALGASGADGLAPLAFQKADSGIFEAGHQMQQSNPEEFYEVLAQVQGMLARSISVISEKHSNSYKYHFLNQQLNTAHAWIASNVKYLSPDMVNFLESRVRAIRGELHDLEKVQADLSWATLLSKSL